MSRKGRKTVRIPNAEQNTACITRVYGASSCIACQENNGNGMPKICMKCPDRLNPKKKVTA